MYFSYAPSTKFAGLECRLTILCRRKDSAALIDRCRSRNLLSSDFDSWRNVTNTDKKLATKSYRTGVVVATQNANKPFRKTSSAKFYLSGNGVEFNHHRRYQFLDRNFRNINEEHYHGSRRHKNDECKAEPCTVEVKGNRA